MIGEQLLDSPGAGPRSVPGWVTSITPGPQGAGQAVGFDVTTDRPELFAVQPTVSPQGELTYTPAAETLGVATLTVIAVDDGGTANGGADTSDPQSAVVELTFDVFVAQPIGGRVSRLDARTGSTRWATDLTSAALAVDPSGEWLYAATNSPPSVQVLNASTGTVTDEIPLPYPTDRMAMTPDGRTALVTHGGDRQVSVVDLQSRSVVSTLDLDPLPPQFASATADNRSVLISLSGRYEVGRFDLETEQVEEVVKFENRVERVMAHPIEPLAFVSVSQVNHIGVVDLESGTLAATIDVGPNPDGIAFSADGAAAYVAIQRDDVVSVIDVATRTVTANIAVGDLPTDVAVDPAGLRLYVTTAGDDRLEIVDLAVGEVIFTRPLTSEGPLQVVRIPR